MTHRIFVMPVLVLMPHSRCNCRCVMCDIWKANHEKRELSVEVLDQHLADFRKLNVQRVALSGGEALMHTNLWAFCERLRSIGINISLLTTGVTLKHHAEDVVKYCDDVIVSLDGTPEVHDVIRNIPGAFARLADGVKAIKEISPAFSVTGRTVLQKQNFRNFSGIVQTAKELGLNKISFLAADVSSEAFNRAQPWSKEKQSAISLNADEANELEEILKSSFEQHRDEFRSGFVAESQHKLLEIVQHYKAAAGQGNFPHKNCNAPWVSAVVDSSGNLSPCFFHEPYGNLNTGNFQEIINSEKAISFRRKLRVNEHPTCMKCVCSLNVGLMQSV